MHIWDMRNSLATPTREISSPSMRAHHLVAHVARAQTGTSREISIDTRTIVIRTARDIVLFKGSFVLVAIHKFAGVACTGTTRSAVSHNRASINSHLRHAANMALLGLAAQSATVNFPRRYSEYLNLSWAPFLALSAELPGKRGARCGTAFRTDRPGVGQSGFSSRRI